MTEEAVYDFINGQRLTTGNRIFVEGGKPVYFVFVITPTATIYSQINTVIFRERIEMFSLLVSSQLRKRIQITLYFCSQT